jgi:hypothetical protein
MKKVVIVVITLSLVAAAIALYVRHEESEESNKCIVLNSEIFFLNDKQIVKQKQLANKGDGAAAHRLYWHFASYTDDYDLAMHWLIRAAEYNDCEAQYNLANTYLGIYNNKELASFWYSRAFVNGICKKNNMTKGQIEEIMKYVQPRFSKHDCN